MRRQRARFQSSVLFVLITRRSDRRRTCFVCITKFWFHSIYEVHVQPQMFKIAGEFSEWVLSLCKNDLGLSNTSIKNKYMANSFEIPTYFQHMNVIAYTQTCTNTHTHYDNVC